MMKYSFDDHNGHVPREGGMMGAKLADRIEADLSTMGGYGDRFGLALAMKEWKQIIAALRSPALPEEKETERALAGD